MNKKETGRLVVISGPSGVGKATVLGNFVNNMPGVRLSISATTRTPRPEELHGRDYYFISREEFQGMVDAGDMLEYAEFSGNYYGTPRKTVEETLQAGCDVVLEIEVKGAQRVKELFPGALFIFIMPPSFAELKRRLIARNTEPEEVIRRRLHASRDEIRRAYWYDYIVINENINEAAVNIQSIIRAARLTVSNMKSFVDGVYQDAEQFYVANH